MRCHSALLCFFSYTLKDSSSQGHREFGSFFPICPRSLSFFYYSDLCFRLIKTLETSLFLWFLRWTNTYSFSVFYSRFKAFQTTGLKVLFLYLGWTFSYSKLCSSIFAEKKIFQSVYVSYDYKSMSVLKVVVVVGEEPWWARGTEREKDSKWGWE